MVSLSNPSIDLIAKRATKSIYQDVQELATVVSPFCCRARLRLFPQFRLIVAHPGNHFDRPSYPTKIHWQFLRHFPISQKASLTAHKHVKTYYSTMAFTSQGDSAQNDGFIM
jgi:hypothetical protein